MMKKTDRARKLMEVNPTMRQAKGIKLYKTVKQRRKKVKMRVLSRANNKQKTRKKL